jgi:hypothetical protein
MYFIKISKMPPCLPFPSVIEILDVKTLTRVHHNFKNATLLSFTSGISSTDVKTLM